MALVTNPTIVANGTIVTKFIFIGQVTIVTSYNRYLNIIINTIATILTRVTFVTTVTIVSKVTIVT